MGEDRRVVIRRCAAATAALAVVLTGCASEEDELSDRIREGLPETSTVARVMDGEPVEVREVALPELPRWRLAEVKATGERPLMTVVAYAPEGEPRSIVLTGFPDRWQSLVGGGTVKDGSRAVEVARAWYDATRRTDELWYRVESVDDVDWQPIVDEQAVTDLKAEYSSMIEPPQARSSDGGWDVTLWAVQQRDLVKHELHVGPDGQVADTPERVEEAMPVSEAV